MNRFSVAALSACFTVLIAAQTQAQVTPEEVWQGWQKMGATYGQALTADSVTRQGDTLVVSGMQVSMDQDGAKISGTLDEVRFRDLGDGTVEVTMSETYPLAMTMPGEDGATEELAITISQPGIRMIAGGSATHTAYTIVAPNTSLAMQAGRNGEKLADINATFSNVNGTYNLAQNGGKSTLDSDVTIEGVAFTATGKSDGQPFDMAGTMAALKVSTAGDFLGAAAMENVAQALRDGFSTTLDFSYGAGDFRFNASDDQGRPVKVAATNQTGTLLFRLAGDSLTYNAGGTGVVMTVSGGEIPFPELKISYAEAGFDLTMPVLRTLAPTPFAFGTRIVDLTVSDEIWGMFDPTVALPRDPATLIIASKGTATLKQDIVDAEAMEAAGTAPAGEINSLDLTSLVLRVAGAAVTGAGSVTFDNTDLVTFDGLPAPTGTVDVTMTGANGLIDKLVSMGLIPDQEVMGLRMMLAMFAKPGEGPDVLTSQVEFKDKGLFVNGTRLK
ncbi:MAG: DUF2125 domain-containing protein [Rhodobacteraceae bacterium]|nr:DUF2125 domain-containing protein [Paracoccaceae bacterium]